MPSDVSDSQLSRLVPAIRSGDVGALGELYDHVAHRLLRVAQRAVRTDADAEDVVHDLFVGLPEALRRYEESGRFVSWLITCTMRLALMRRRADSRRREDDWHPIHEPSASDRPDLAPELSEAFRRIAALPEAQRDVVLLRSEGLSHLEIAQTLGISEGNSRIRLARALERLLSPS